MNRPTLQTLRPPRSSWIVLLIASAVILTMAVVAFHLGLAWWNRVAFGLLSAAVPVAMAELALERVTLGTDHLTLVKNFRRRVIPREDVESVTWGKGAGVHIKLTNGSWVELPSVGRTSQGVTNTIRAWIRRSN